MLRTRVPDKSIFKRFYCILMHCTFRCKIIALGPFLRGRTFEPGRGLCFPKHTCTRHDRQNVSPEQLSLLDSSLLKQWLMLSDSSATIAVFRDNYSADDSDVSYERSRTLGWENRLLFSWFYYVALFVFYSVVESLSFVVRCTGESRSLRIILFFVDIFYSFRVFFFFLICISY